jgi:sterol desaturase/sphingolipid hydroxylase (fatty acid hydroxylase superfamily)
MWNYSYWLAALAALFIVLERLWPRRSSQSIFRRGWFLDLLLIVFNSRFAAMILGYLTIYWIADLDAIFARGWVARWSPPAQFVILLVTTDFVKWCVHNLMHRVSFLWRFHRLHHGVEEMDWLSDWRFHPAEVIFYNSALYFPAALLGVAGNVALAVGIFDTLIGHFAHANLRFRIGWLKYIINSPQMHLWHHNHPDCGPVNRNFAVTLSVWDWLFGTAHVPSDDPSRLGLPTAEQP